MKVYGQGVGLFHLAIPIKLCVCAQKIQISFPRTLDEIEYARRLYPCRPATSYLLTDHVLCDDTLPPI